MFELKKLKTRAVDFANAMFCHRAIYAWLAVCHASGCVLTDGPELYGAIALLHLILALKD